MKKGTNDNDTWTSIGLAAARVLESCEQQKEQRERDAQRDREKEEKAEQHRRAVNQGLRDIASFEERASGKTVRIRRNRN